MLAFALAEMVAIACIRRTVLPQLFEVAIRALARFVGLLLVPVLLRLAYGSWTNRIRPHLAVWRNGLGLSSVVVLSVVWLSYGALLLIFSVRPDWTRFYDPTWYGVLLFLTLCAALLAVALRGDARMHLISAALCVDAWLQSMVYSGSMSRALEWVSRMRAR